MFRRLRALIMVTFGFSRTEARAFIILLPLMFVIVFSRPIYEALFWPRPSHLFNGQELDSLLSTLTWDEIDSLKSVKHHVFRFNPNNVSLSQMDSLGIPSYLAQRVERYRSKGGKFKTKSDLQKIYGFDTVLFASLEPFIDLPSVVKKKEYPAVKNVIPSARQFHSTKSGKETFDLNVADTTTLDGVYGIGPSLARRIILYRERLGGFISEEQLYEVWGLDSGVVAKTMEQATIAVDFVPHQIKINTAAEAELAGHPYIRHKTARLIVAYRFQHGNFLSIEDLGKTIFIDAKSFERIKPYLTLE